MKKITVLLTILIAFAITSCKKDRTCECNLTISGAAYTKSYELGKTKKSDAQTVCNSYKTTYNWDECTVK